MKAVSSRLYLWVIVGIVAGICCGIVYPNIAVNMKPLGQGFILLTKTFIAPIIFCTVVLGIANMHDMKQVGRVAAKALIYFEIVSTIALAFGILMVNMLAPGKGFNVDPSALDPTAVSAYAQQAQSRSILNFIMGMIPQSFAGAFVGGEILQVLLMAVLFGVALGLSQQKGQPVKDFLESITQVFFKMISIVMLLAPIGAFGAMAFTIGQFGINSILPLLHLLGAFYLTSALFIVLVLGMIARYVGFNIFQLIGYLRAELLTVLGTSSSESVIAPLMERLERLGCSRSVVHLVVPSGYSFNLDGTNMYLSLAAIFVAQAMNIHLSWGQQLTLLAVAMLTSKGAAGVTGAGFITLAATLSVIPDIPVTGLALILGIDRFMSECRSLTNLIGNAVATLFIAKWEKALDPEKMQVELQRNSVTDVNKWAVE